MNRACLLLSSVLWVACPPAPSPQLPCTAVGELTAKASLVPDGGVTATGSRYSIPFASSAPTGRIYVSPSGDDNAAGTEAAPLKTIQAGFDAAEAGVAVMIRAGTYTENLVLSHSGVDGGPIWLVSADGPGLAKLVPAKLDQSTVQGSAIHDLVLQGLDITAPSPTTGDTDGIKFAANGDITVPENQNVHLAVVDCTVHCSTDGSNGVKIGATDWAYVIHDVLDGAGGGSTNGVALDFVGNTNSEIAWTWASNVPTHAAFEIKGGSTTVSFHDNLVSAVGGDGLWVGGATVESSMRPSTAYEACDVTVHNAVMIDMGKSSVHFVGGQNSKITHLLSAHTGNVHVLVAPGTQDHLGPIPSIGDSLLFSVFDPSQQVRLVDPANVGDLAVDPVSDLDLKVESFPGGHHDFAGAQLITSGGGNDTYTLTARVGTTVISGFQVDSDVVHLGGYFGLPDFRTLLDGAHQVGPDVLIDLPDGFLLVFRSLTLAQLKAANFTF